MVRSWIYQVFIVLLAINGSMSLTIYGLSIEPQAVRKGAYATLRCLYDLGGAPLYSVKWYRGQHEFYRYSPSELPPNKIFPFPGIHVDLPNSNASQVLLHDVGFSLSGNFSCEVTADAPLFSTATKTREMTVVQLPAGGPVLLVERPRYDIGDILRANCTSMPSRPRPDLTFMLNNLVVSKGETQHRDAGDGLESGSLYMELQVLPSHFTAGPGVLVLRCTSHVAQLYMQSAEVSIGFPARDPIPARVTSAADKHILQKKIIIQLITALLMFFTINR